MTETGTLDTIIDKHYTGWNTNTAQAAATSGAVTCSPTAAGAVMSCAFSCGVTISFNATSNGVGTTVNFPSGNVFASSAPYPLTCTARSITLPPSCCTGGIICGYRQVCGNVTRAGAPASMLPPS
jgi:hypothetical protein